MADSRKELEEVLRQLDDRTNQTWAVRRARWARMVREQDAEIAALEDKLAALTAAHDVTNSMLAEAEAQIAALRAALSAQDSVANAPEPVKGPEAVDTKLADVRRRFGSILAGLTAEQQAAFEREMVR